MGVWWPADGCMKTDNALQDQAVIDEGVEDELIEDRAVAWNDFRERAGVARTSMVESSLG